MGTIAASAVISRVSTLLQDPTNIRWPTSELLSYLNDGQREIALYKPNACITNGPRQLVAGTKQTIPSDGVQLVDVVRNLGASGTAAGKSIRLTMREILDAQNPDWHTATPSGVVQHYTYNPLDPKTFYVYPPQPSVSPHQVELVYAAAPADLSATNQSINVDDVYFSVLVDYMMYRAYSKDSEYAADAPRAEKHQRAYIATLTGKLQVEAGSNPNVAAPANPNVTPVNR